MSSPSDISQDEDTKSWSTSSSSSSFRRKMKGAFKALNPVSPAALADLKIMKRSMSLEGLVTKDLQDTALFPEVANVAEVRRGLDLAPDEAAYLKLRKVYIRDHFAKYMGLDPAEVHPDDVPIVSFGGSGGGFRAMFGVLGYCDEMKKSGLWDVLTYIAGVSGSCWSIAAYYAFGDADWGKVIEHCKKRFSPYHPLSSDAIRKVLLAPGGAHITLGPLVQKHHSGLKTVAMDLYSVFTTGYVFLHDPVEDPTSHGAKKEVAGYHRDWFKWSSATKHLEDGKEPLPILTAIRHERPWKDWIDKESPFTEADPQAKQHREAQDAWFQWFEMTPYEVGCDELEAWCPTWGFGRPFSEGKSVMQLPEQSLALLLGLCTSAPAGPLTAYIATIKRMLPTGFIGDQVHRLAAGIAKMWGKQGTEEFQQHHPLHACNEHNFLFHMTHVEKGQPRPPGLENSPRIHLIDGGIDNNCPTYVLLHPNREVDVIINMDASSDVQEVTFQERVDQIGSRRGMKFSPRHEVKIDPKVKEADRFKGNYAQIYDGVLHPRPNKVVDSYGHTVANPPAPISHHECSIIYMPLFPNFNAVPNFNPSTEKWSGSYNLVWTADQVETLLKVCRANFAEGEENIKAVLHETWQRKRDKREGRMPPSPDINSRLHVPTDEHMKAMPPISSAQATPKLEAQS